MFRNNLRKQYQQQSIFGRGKRKQRPLGLKTILKRTFQYIKQQQTNGSYISVPIKTTQKNPKQSCWNLNSTADFITDFLLLFNFPSTKFDLGMNFDDLIKDAK